MSGRAARSRCTRFLEALRSRAAASKLADAGPFFQCGPVGHDAPDGRRVALKTAINSRVRRR
jgi:hypothetical protein